MEKIKVLAVFGTRPEAIKLCPLIRLLRSREEFCCTVCHTAQHRDLSDVPTAALGVTPDYDLDIMTQGQSLSRITSRALAGLDSIIKKEKPDLLLVQGDTATAFAGALAAFYNGVKIGHVEAGLRSHHIHTPFPEEAHRRMIARVSHLDFAPTEADRQVLIAEGKDPARVYVTGNTAMDALALTLRPDFHHEVLDRLQGGEKLLLLTTHRRENTGEPMTRIFAAVKEVLHRHGDCRLLYPMHPNPRVREIAREMLGSEPHVFLTEPLPVAEFHNILARSYAILTDSGGIQEEACHLGKPTLVLRDVTERQAGVEAGVLRLVGTDTACIVRALEDLLCNKATYTGMARSCPVFGDGHAGERIVHAILSYFAEYEQNLQAE